MKKTKCIIIAIIFLLSVPSFGNDSLNLVKYTPDFKFTDGVFLDFEQVKNNNPIQKASVLTTLDYNDNDFFEQLFKSKVFSFYDNLGQKFNYPVKDVWGYSNNGVLYKEINGDFFRITIVGSICHFVAYVTTYDYAQSPYYDPYGRYGNSYRTSARSEKTDLKQYIIDFNSGRVLEYTISNLEALFVEDPELFEEWSGLRKKKKKQKKFLYIRKFNDRNPIYFKNKLMVPPNN